MRSSIRWVLLNLFQRLFDELTVEFYVLRRKLHMRCAFQDCEQVLSAVVLVVVDALMVLLMFVTIQLN
jgi:hypothetical protein